MSMHYYAILNNPYVDALQSDYIKENYGPVYSPKRKKLKGYQKK